MNAKATNHLHGDEPCDSNKHSSDCDALGQWWPSGNYVYITHRLFWNQSAAFKPLFAES